MTDLKPIEPSTLYFGDCLEVMAEWYPGQVDLIYLDPPFNSNANYNVLFGDANPGTAQMTAFTDTWTWDEAAVARVDDLKAMKSSELWRTMEGLERILGPSGMLSYLSYMAERLEACRRILKPNGSIYLHCDPTAGHYLKIVMDAIFGSDRFRNEVVWKRTGAHGGAKRWGPIHDTLLFYGKGDTHCWNRVYEKYDPEYLASFYRQEDRRGRYGLVSLTGPGVRHGHSGKPWRGVNPTEKGRHWSIPPVESLPSNFVGSLDWYGMTCQDKLEHMDKAGLIYWPKRGKVPRHKRYLSESDGNPLQDIISDIKAISSQAKERLPYPTQKPRALLERIIKASSNEGDLVLDPFCGCGTTVVAAQSLKRRWAGIDISAFAVTTVMSERLRAVGVVANIDGTPKDFESAKKLAEEDPFKFERWAIHEIPDLASNQKQRKDGGVDGRGTLLNKAENGLYHVVAQVKAGKATMDSVRAFETVMRNEKAACGIFITLMKSDVSKGQREIAASHGTFTIKDSSRQYPVFQFWSIEEWFAYHKSPNALPRTPELKDPYAKKRPRTLYQQPQVDLPKAAETRAPYGRKK